MPRSRFLRRAGLAAGALAFTAAAAPPPPAPPPPSYADLADLSDAADLVVHARVKRAIAVPPERAGNVAPGHARVYIEADTVALIAGNAPLGGSVKYLVDVPLDAKGKAP